jgi:hypothetical protein
LNPLNTVALLGVLALPLTLGHAGEVTGGYPSQEVGKQREDSKPLALLVFPFDDLRTLFADRTVIESRQSRGVCVFDGSARKKGLSEVPIKSEDTVAEVLAKVGLGDWHGKGPQIKIITKNAIIQSPYPGITAEPKLIDEFLKTRISPGDFVYLPVQM